MNSDYKYGVVMGKKPTKFLNKQDLTTKERIWQAVEKLSEVPPEGDITKMWGFIDTYRLRVGTYRIIFKTDEKERTNYVVAIGNRGDIYK